MYGKGQLTNSLITKARSTVATYYSIPGQLSEEEISDRVRWLLFKGKFRYGGVNTQVYNFFAYSWTILTELIIRTRHTMLKHHSHLL